jgi:hypothetical protein
VGPTITGFVDDNEVLGATDSEFRSGNARLVTGDENSVRNTAFFDNLTINTVDGRAPAPRSSLSAAPFTNRKLRMAAKRLWLIKPRPRLLMRTG